MGESVSTTKGKSVPKALRMIAGWLEEGRRIEYFDVCKWVEYKDAENGPFWPVNFSYRATSRKPRTALFHDNPVNGRTPGWYGIELTDEVKDCLVKGGIL